MYTTDTYTTEELEFLIASTKKELTEALSASEKSSLKEDLRYYNNELARMTRAAREEMNNLCVA